MQQEGNATKQDFRIIKRTTIVEAFMILIYMEQ
jgi:hypothetical protein